MSSYFVLLDALNVMLFDSHRGVMLVKQVTVAMET